MFPNPLIPFSNVVVFDSPSAFMFKVPLFAISISAAFSLNITFVRFTVPAFVITADPVFPLNVTFDTLRVPFSVPIFCTVIALSKPEYSCKSSIVNSYLLVFNPLK